MLHGLPWFLLGSLWAILFSEYRAFQQRLKLGARIQALEAELAIRANEQFECEKAYRDVRLELLHVLEVARSTRKVKKNFDAMTKAEVMEYIADHKKRPPSLSRRALEVIRFFEDNARNFGDQNSTMRECWQVAVRARAALKAANEG